MILIQALELLKKWSPMDVDDALELLSTNYKHEKVRQYAVSRLWKADDEVSVPNYIFSLLLNYCIPSNFMF